MLSRHCPVLYDFPFHHSAALDLTSSVFGFFYGPSFHFLSSPADQARMPKNNVTKRIIPTPIRCITTNIASIIFSFPFTAQFLFSPNFLHAFFVYKQISSAFCPDILHLCKIISSSKLYSTTYTTYICPLTIKYF